MLNNNRSMEAQEVNASNVVSDGSSAEQQAPLSTSSLAAASPQQQQPQGEQLNLPPPSPQTANEADPEANNNNINNNSTNSTNTALNNSSANESSIADNSNVIGNTNLGGNSTNTYNNTSPLQKLPLPPPSDFDSDTELSIVAAAAAAAAAANSADHLDNASALTTNGHVYGGSNINNGLHIAGTNNNLSLNAKQQRQQKRRRERAQRLQAERDNRSTAANATSTVTSGLLGYHANSAGSMGEDSNNSNGNFTSSSNGSNNVLPPTDSIASLLLNPPQSPECNSGLMATPSDSEGESLDEDLLSTSSSSTLLLPRDKPPPRPPPPIRRKLPRSPILEEEIIDGFAILEFKTYEDLEFAIKLGQKRKEKRLSALEELTSPYSIEETKMPKIVETVQPHPIRGGGGGMGLGGPMLNHSLKDVSNMPRSGSLLTNLSTSTATTTITSTQPVPMDISTNIEASSVTVAGAGATNWKSQYQGSNNKNNVNNGNNNNNNTSSNFISNTTTTPTPTPATTANQKQNSTMTSATITNHNGDNCHNINSNATSTNNGDNENEDSQGSQGGRFEVAASRKLQQLSSSTATTSSLNNNLDGGLSSRTNHKTLSNDLSKTDGIRTAEILINAANKPLNSPQTGGDSLKLQAMTNDATTTSTDSRLASGQMSQNMQPQVHDAPRTNSIAKGFLICDSGNEEIKGTEKLGPIVFPSTPTQHVSNATPSPTTPRKSSDYPPQPTTVNVATTSSNAFATPSTATTTTTTSSSSPAVNETFTASTNNAAATNATGPNKTATVVGNSSSNNSPTATTSTLPTSSFVSPQILGTNSTAEKTNVGPSSNTAQNSSAANLSKAQQITSLAKPYSNVPNEQPRSMASATVAAQAEGTSFNAKVASSSQNASKIPPPSSIGLPPMPPRAMPTMVTPSTTTATCTTNTTSATNTLGGGFPNRLVSLPPPPAANALQPNLYSTAPILNSSGMPSKHVDPITGEMLKGAPPPPPPTSTMVNGFMPPFAPTSSSATSATPPAISRVSPLTSIAPTSTQTPPSFQKIPHSSSALTPPTSSLSSSSSMGGPFITTSASMPPMHISGHNLFSGGNLAMPGGFLAPPGAMLGGPMPPNGIAPMLISTSPYRPPYANYSLYTPYGTLQHSPYLPPAPPAPMPSVSPRNNRESPLIAGAKPTASNVRPPTPVSSGAASTSRTASPATSMGNSNNNNSLVTGPTVASAASQHFHHPAYGVAGPHGAPLPMMPGGVVPLSHSSATISIGHSGSTTMTMTPSSISMATTLSTAVPSTVMSSVPFAPSSLNNRVIGGDTHLLPPPTSSHNLTHSHLTQQQQQLPPQHAVGGASGLMPPIPHLLTHHPSTLPPHMHNAGLIRGTSPSSGPQQPIVSNASNNSNLGSINASSHTTSSTMSSSVIQRVLSPKSESPNKERDINYSISRPSTLVTNTHGGLMPPTPPYSTAMSSGTMVSFSSTATGAQSLMSANAYNSSPLGQTPHHHPSHHVQLAANSTAATTVLTSSQPIMSTPHSLPYPPPKTSMWPPSSTLSTSTTAAAATTSSGAMRRSPAPNAPTATVNLISPQTTHSANNSTGFPTPYFAAPLPPTGAPSMVAPNVASVSSSLPPPTSTSFSSAASSGAMTTTTTTQSTAPHPFSAESLFQPSKNDQADLLRRELDSRFLDRSGLVPQQPSAPGGGPSAYMRQELHHHQHQHTHLHQHQSLLAASGLQPSGAHAPTSTAAPIFPPPLFKDIPKISTVDSPFYRTGIGLPPPAYAGYSPAGLLHPGLGGPTPFMPPSHLASFAPKPPQPQPQQPSTPSICNTNPPTNLESSKSTKFTKTGRWNAMHVRIAWEIYYHQNKQNPDKLSSSSAPGSNLSSGSSQNGNTGIPNLSSTGAAGPSVPPPSLSLKPSPALSLSGASPHMLHRPGELPPSAYALPGRSPFETSPLSTSFIGAPPSHIGTAVSPFGRYVNPFGFGLSHFGREIQLSGAMHDPWRTALQRGVPYHPAAGPAWQLKPDPALENARREAEEREREREREMREREQRERQARREREERERKEKEEKIKREQQEREQRERERERERERKERERRELERREMERERLMQQQRINENNKAAAAAAAAAAAHNAIPRDRSPHRNSVGEMTGGGVVGGSNDIRIKEEHPGAPRTKEEQDAMIMRSAAAAAAAAADPRYHPSLAAAQAAAAHHASFMASRHGPHMAPPPPHMARTMLPTLGGPPMTHFGPPPGPPGWPMDPYGRDPYGPMLRYNPLMEALRHEEAAHKAAMSMYAAQSAAHLRAKEPSPIPPPSMGPPSTQSPHLRIQSSPLSSVVPQPPPAPTLAPPPGAKPTMLVGGPLQGHSIAVDSLLASNAKKEDLSGMVQSSATMPGGR